MVVELIARAATGAHAPPWLEAVRRLLDRDYREKVNLADIAEEVRVHRVHLARQFTRHYGLSAREYLRSVRLAEAARRLAESELPVAEVAIEAGFFDQSHLTRAFRARFGVPPAAFRRARRPASPS